MKPSLGWSSSFLGVTTASPLFKNAHRNLPNFRNGDVSSISWNTPHDLIRHLHFKNFLSGKEGQVKKEASIESSESPIQLILFLGTMVLATLFFNQLGYPLISFLLMVALLRILGIKRWGLNILISVVTAVGSYFLFVQWLDIPMPKGWIGI